MRKTGSRRTGSRGSPPVVTTAAPARGCHSRSTGPRSGDGVTPDLARSAHEVRAINPDDRAALTAILAEPDVARWWIHGDLESTVAGLYNDASGVRLTIEVNGEDIGYIKFSEALDPDYRHASIDLFVSTSWHGRGIGPEAIRLVARHLFEKRGHRRITIDPAVANEHAIRACEKVGFRPIGTMRRSNAAPMAPGTTAC